MRMCVWYQRTEPVSLTPFLLTFSGVGNSGPVMIDLSEYDLVYDYGDDASGEDYPANHQSYSRRWTPSLFNELYNVSFITLFILGHGPWYVVMLTVQWTLRATHVLTYMDHTTCKHLEYCRKLWIFSAPSLSVSVSHTDTWRAVIALAFRALQFFSFC